MRARKWTAQYFGEVDEPPARRESEQQIDAIIAACAKSTKWIVVDCGTMIHANNAQARFRKMGYLAVIRDRILYVKRKALLRLPGETVSQAKKRTGPHA
jgi:hypothetical protein